MDTNQTDSHRLNSFDHYNLPEYDALSMVTSDFDIVQMYGVEDERAGSTNSSTGGIVELQQSPFETVESFERVF